MSLLPFVHRVCARENLSASEAFDAMMLILEGGATIPQVTAFLVALRMKGETANEILGFARAMREKVEPVHPGLDGEPLVDTCGTGGGCATFNVSTVAAFVIAGAGVRVAKHGNRSFSSQCGSADLLEALGVNIQLSARQVAASIRETGIGFMFAPSLHPAMKHAQPARAELKMRTVFNLLGPLTNPAGARAQVIGSPSPESAELLATALVSLGGDHAFVVHGFEGLDEVSTSGPTLVYEIVRGDLRKHVWTPRDFGVPQASLYELEGGGRERNAEIARAVLGRERGPQRDIVVVNAAVALVAAGRTENLRAAARIAAESIDSGAANTALDRLTRFSQSATIKQEAKADG
jgi:anthranilate phosphoribosyltransferase